MFLDRFIIGNLWNICLICVMLVLKRMVQTRVSLRFQYYSWYALAVSLLLPFFPNQIWNAWPATPQNASQTIATYHLASNTVPIVGNAHWADDVTELIVADTRIAPLELFILAIWLIGVLALIGFYWCGSYRLRQIRHFAMTPAKKIQDVFDACCKQLRIKKDVQIRQSRFIAAPISFGWKKPFVVFPGHGINDLPQTELEHIVLHELTHIRHGDLITNYLFCGIQALYWFNPLVWLAFRQMRRDRESYCDWAVLNEMGNENDRRAYGQTILNFAAGCRTRFFTASGLCQSKDQLKYRLEQIVDYRKDTRWRKIGGWCLTVIFAILCIVQIPALALCVEDGEDYYTPADNIAVSKGDWSSFFPGDTGCAVVYDLNADRYTVYNEGEITHRVPPCSTFKIYSALNALEQGIITPTDNTLSWDGTKREFAAWNQDHNLHSAMQESANWYFQSIDQAAGVEQLSEFYKSIHYGNSVIGNETSNYWNGSALKISALEQVELLVKLYQNAWNFESTNVDTVKSSLLMTDSGEATLYGKTGTGKIDSTNIAGWFVGFVEQSENTYFFAIYLCSDTGADGTTAIQIAVDIMDSIGIKINMPA